MASTGETVTMACIPQGMTVTSELQYDVMESSHPDCGFFNRRQGRDVETCNIAFHSWCVGQGHETGLGPLEVDSGAAIYHVGCLSD
jgi:hypothetical protein